MFLIKMLESKRATRFYIFFFAYVRYRFYCIYNPIDIFLPNHISCRFRYCLMAASGIICDYWRPA